MRKFFYTMVALFYVSLFSIIPAQADCKNTDLAFALNRLENHGRLHNCQIELVTRLLRGNKQYMLLVNDLTPILEGERPPVSFEFQIDPMCITEFDGSISGKTIHYSYGYSTPLKNYKVAINVQMGRGNLPTQLTIQNIDLVSHQVDQRVACRLDQDDL